LDAWSRWGGKSSENRKGQLPHQGLRALSAAGFSKKGKKRRGERLRENAQSRPIFGAKGKAVVGQSRQIRRPVGGGKKKKKERFQKVKKSGRWKAGGEISVEGRIPRKPNGRKGGARTNSKGSAGPNPKVPRKEGLNVVGRTQLAGPAAKMGERGTAPVVEEAHSQRKLKERRGGGPNHAKPTPPTWKKKQKTRSGPIGESQKRGAYNKTRGGGKKIRRPGWEVTKTVTTMATNRDNPQGHEKEENTVS